MHRTTAAAPLRTLLRTTAAAVACAALPAATGCGLFGPEEVRVDIFSTHFGAPINGIIPDYGADGGPRRWTNEEGWKIDLLDGYVVITAASVVDCDGVEHPMDLSFGPVVEHLLFTDRDVITFGTTKVEEGELCKVIVEYGPYRAEDAAMVASPFPIPTKVDLEGKSVFLSGVATLGEEKVGFMLASSASQTVEVDLRAPGGGPAPYALSASGSGGRVTVAKTYDAFFRGVDFATADLDALAGELVARIAAETAAYHGTTAY